MRYDNPESVPSDWQVGDVILDRYEVRERFEGGGMGLVYRVYHREWKIDLAVKAPRALFFQSNEQMEDFEYEAKTWVNLGPHQHIASCHYVRRLGGVPHLFAEFVEGGTLADWIRDGRLYKGTSKERTLRVLNVAIQIALALEFAHGKGLVHQDVKPANILMTRDGVAKLTDFGLARARSKMSVSAQVPPNSGHSIWVEGAGMLTPEYAAPEQFEGSPISPRSDGWSWALTVLEMMQGGRGWTDGRFGREALSDHYQGLLDTDPIAKILEQHLTYSPHQRPANLQSAIESLSAIERVTGRDFTRDNLDQLCSSADLLNNRALSLLDLGHAQEAVETLDEALSVNPGHLEASYNRALILWRQGTILNQAFQRAVNIGYPMSAKESLLMGLWQIESGDFEAAQALLVRSLQYEEHNEARVALKSIGGNLKGMEEDLGKRKFEGHMGSVSAIKLSCDGTKLLTGGGAWIKEENRYLYVSLRLWDWASEKCLMNSRGHTDAITSAAFAPEGDYVVTGSKDKTIRLWSLTLQKCISIFHGHTSQVNAVSISPSTQSILSASDDGTVRLWNIAKCECIHVLQGHAYSVNSVLFTADGTQCISVANDGVFFWHLVSGRCTRKINIEAKLIAQTPDSKWLLVGSSAALHLIEVGSGRVVREISTKSNRQVCVAMSDDGKFALSGGAKIQLWRLSDGKCMRIIDLPARDVFYMANNKWALWVGTFLQVWSPPEVSSSEDYRCPFVFCRPTQAQSRNLFQPSDKFPPVEELVEDMENFTRRTQVSLTSDQVPTPGALISGQVSFSDGQDASWSLDQTGRLGLSGPPKGYIPPKQDIPSFQDQLDRLLQQAGF